MKYPGPCEQCGHHRERNQPCDECSNRRACQWQKANREHRAAYMREYRRKKAHAYWEAAR